MHGSISVGGSAHPRCRRGRGRAVAAARRFGVSVSSAVRWVAEFERSGRTAPKPQGGDRRSGRIEAQADLLMDAIEAVPDATLAELRERLIAERGGELRAEHDPRLLSPPRGHVQKKSAHASEQARADVAERRAAWIALQPELDPARLVFLDETGATTKMARLRGRGPGGTRCRAAVPHGHWKTTTLVAALRRDGLTAPMLVDGAMDGEMFAAYARATSEQELPSKTSASARSRRVCAASFVTLASRRRAGPSKSSRSNTAAAMANLPPVRIMDSDFQHSGNPQCEAASAWAGMKARAALLKIGRAHV